MKKLFYYLFAATLFCGFVACDEFEPNYEPEEEEVVKPDDDGREEEVVKPNDGKEDDKLEFDYDYYAVDLGLSVKWAICNVGAYRPEDCGNYFAWGEIAEKSEYTSQNSTTTGESFSDISGHISYDAARANWGGEWRMPTHAECQELKSKCTWTDRTINGTKGVEVKGPNGNSSFLPLTGHKHDKYRSLTGMGFYWSSTPYDSYRKAYMLNFTCSEYSDKYIVYDDEDRYLGHCIRPVVN